MPRRSLTTLSLAAALMLLAAWPSDAAENPVAELETEEAPPRPEPPYPTDEPMDTELKRAAAPDPDELPIPRPIKIDEEGNYYYGTDTQAPTPSGASDVASPESTTSSGAYIYDKQVSPPQFSQTPGIEAPIRTLKSGEFQYKLPVTKSKRAAGFRFGAMTPPALKNSENGLTFQDIYGGNLVPILIGDYEFRRMNTAVGRISLKFTTGAAISNAQGHFKDASRTDKPDERYMFVLMPNALTAHFRFQFKDKQIFIPFIEGGGGYYTVAEIRDDGARPRAGGGFVGVAAGGVYFLMDWADPAAVRQLESDYGINHVWLALEGRGAVNVFSELDFTSFTGNVGFMMEF